MDDSLKTLDLSAEGTVSVPPVVPTPSTAPLGASTPPPAPQPTIVTQSSGPTDKKPMGKKTKIVAGVITAILLFGGLGVGLFLASNRQNPNSKATSAAGDCRCSGSSIICETGDGGYTYMGEDPSCQSGPPPQFTKVDDSNNSAPPAADAKVVDTIITRTNVVNNNDGTKTTTTSTTTVDGQTILTSYQTNELCKTKPDDPTCKAPSLPPANTITDTSGKSVNPSTISACQCGGWNQGACDNNKTSAGFSCGYGCQPGLVFCTNTGSCQTACADPTFVDVGPYTSNKDAYNCVKNGNCVDSKGTHITVFSLNSGQTVSGPTVSSTFTGKIAYDGGGLTRAQCTTTNSEGKQVDVWCGGIPEAPVSQPLLKNGFCGIAGIQKGLTCDQQFKANFGFNFTGGCGTKTATGGDGNLGTPTTGTCNYSGSDIDIFNWTWDMYKGFTIKNLGAGAQKVRYVCKDKTSLQGGCTCAVSNSTCTRYENSIAFDWKQCGVQQIDIDVPIPGSTGQVYHVSRNIYNESCGGTPPTTTTTTTTTVTSEGNPPGGTTPTPPTTTSSYQCYQLQILRGGSVINASQVNVGDSVVFRGFATASNTTVSKMRFTVSVNGVIQAPVDVNASLVGGQYQADLPYTITQAASYSVTTAPISP